MRILVCGGRDYNDSESAFIALDRANAKRKITTIIHGAAQGADSLAGLWAESNGVEELRFPADWKENGKAAGPIRNQRMLDDAKPDGVIAFPGGIGTRDMIIRAKKAGITVWQPYG